MSVARSKPKRNIDKILKPAGMAKVSKKETVNVNELLETAPKAKFSTKTRPMLATLVDKPFDKEGWSFEIKWDGYRALSFINGKSVELKSRNEKSFNEKFYPIYEAVKAWGL